ncbi:hypothetical protein TRVL_05072 [Trypanosoma vivax]|nr:hypothetical protein TRVL_05072 [Trypanosoma vivax]
MRCPSYAVFLCAALAAVCVGHSFGEYFQSSPRSDDAEYHQQHESNEQMFDPDSSGRLELLEALVAEAENKSSSDVSSSGSSGSSVVYDYGGGASTGGNNGAGSAGGGVGTAGGNDRNTDGNGDNTGGVGSAGGDVGGAGGDAGTGSKGSTNDRVEDNTNNDAGGSNQTPKETTDTTQTTDSTEATAGAGSNSKAEDGAAAVLSSGAAWFNIIMVLARGS